MKLWPFGARQERREEAQLSSSALAWDVLRRAWGIEKTDDPVTIKSALGVPMIFSAVEFLSGTLAKLPIHIYDEDGEEIKSPVYWMLSSSPAPGNTAWAWRKILWRQYFTVGRSISTLDRGPDGRIRAIWPTVREQVTVKRRDGRPIYEIRDGTGRVRVYEARDVLDLWFDLKDDLLTERSPIFANQDTVSEAIALGKYARRYYRSGGIPPFLLTGPFKTPGGIKRGSTELQEAIEEQTSESRLVLSLPEGHDVKPIGSNVVDAAYEVVWKSLLVKIAQIYQLPPLFLQDLSTGTYSNTEQQDLVLVKHNLSTQCEQFEQEAELKFYGRRPTRTIKHSLEGILRGDLKSRSEAFGRMIATAQITPNEVRELENRPPLDGGDELLIQGALKLLTDAGTESEEDDDPGDGSENPFEDMDGGDENNNIAEDENEEAEDAET